MGMLLDGKSQTLIINFPNSEAVIQAQHNGNVDREVGMYYINQQVELIESFFNGVNTKCYIDIALSLDNLGIIINKLTSNNLEEAFKSRLVPQINILSSLRDFMYDYKDYFHQLKLPYLSKTKKYLIIPSEDEVSKNISTLALGDIVSINFKKLNIDTIIMYLDKREDFENNLSAGHYKSWIYASNRAYKPYIKKEK